MECVSSRNFKILTLKHKAGVMTSIATQYSRLWGGRSGRGEGLGRRATLGTVTVGGLGLRLLYAVQVQLGVHGHLEASLVDDIQIHPDSLRVQHWSRSTLYHRHRVSQL